MQSLTFGDLKWLAGFIEGDGWFGYSSSRRRFVVGAGQAQLWPLTECKRLCGGKVWTGQRKASMKGKPYSQWALSGPRGVGLAMTLYSMMSPDKRRQIEKALAGWRRTPVANRERLSCIRGHPFGGPSVRGRQRKCMECRRWHGREAYRRVRAKAGYVVYPRRGGWPRDDS